MRSRLRSPFLLLATAWAPLFAARPAPTPDPKSALELRQAYQLLARQEARPALEAFRRANKLAAGRCFRCLEGIAAAQMRLGDSDGAVVAARDCAKVAANAEESARALNQLGLALALKAGKQQAGLAEAEAAYRKAFEISGGKLSAALYNLAGVLLRQGKQTEGLEALAEYLKREPVGARAAQARSLQRSPHRAGESLAPDFAVGTLSGDRLSLEDLRGKVLLVDFWATWCGPCRMALPELKSLKKEMSREPFELFSVSADRDLATLKAFVVSNEMIWPQYWDQKAELARSFSVPAYPSYYLIDGDGVIVYSAHGWSPRTGQEIASEVKKAVAKAKKPPSS